VKIYTKTGDDVSDDKDHELEERRAYLEESKSQEAFD